MYIVYINIYIYYNIIIMMIIIICIYTYYYCNSQWEYCKYLLSNQCNGIDRTGLLFIVQVLW